MRIHIHSDGRKISLILPTQFLFNKGILKFGLRVGKKYSDEVPDIPPEAVDALCDEIKRIKKRYGSWDLVDVRSADGEQVHIIL